MLLARAVAKLAERNLITPEETEVEGINLALLKKMTWSKSKNCSRSPERKAGRCAVR